MKCMTCGLDHQMKDFQPACFGALRTRVAELEAALKWIANCTDLEMMDGDGARTIAQDALDRK